MGIVVKDALKMKKICNALEISLGRHQVTTFTETANVLAGFYILKMHFKTCLNLDKTRFTIIKLYELFHLGKSENIFIFIFDRKKIFALSSHFYVWP